MKDKRYIFGVIAAVVVAVIAIILIVNRPAGTTTRSGNPDAPQTVNLSDYANRDSSVSFTTLGRIVGDGQFEATRITITPTERRVEVLNGYDFNIVGSQTFPNTAAGYATLLEALKQSGYSRQQKSPIEDYRGICPQGQRYTYTLNEPGRTVFNNWSASCARNGTFAGNGSQVRQLFRAQIPNYSRVVSDARQNQ